MAKRETLLLDWVYYNPLGHVIEGMKIAKGYRAARRGLEVHLLLNADAPVELAQRASWITRAWAIDTRDVLRRGARAPCLRGLPRRWDYVVYDDRPERSPETHHRWLRELREWSRGHFEARAWHGGADERFAPDPDGRRPAYLFDEPIDIRPPVGASRWAQRFRNEGPLFVVLPAGSWAPVWYPRLETWDAVLSGVFAAFPEARVVLTGASDRGDGRTSSGSLTRARLDPLFRSHPRLEDAWDVGLWKQVALLRRATALISPHTGFGFLAPAVGTPWLALSGGMWPELFFNQRPFVSVLPSCPVYPCYGRLLDACRDRALEGRQVQCMEHEPQCERIPEIVAGLRRLTGPGFDYAKAVADHRRKVRSGPWVAERFFSHDIAIDYTGRMRPDQVTRHSRSG